MKKHYSIYDSRGKYWKNIVLDDKEINQYRRQYPKLKFKAGKTYRKPQRKKSSQSFFGLY